jgi:hypothetical protein
MEACPRKWAYLSIYADASKRIAQLPHFWRDQASIFYSDNYPDLVWTIGCVCPSSYWPHAHPAERVCEFMSVLFCFADHH